jgi:site-specific recombinase XerD
MRLGDLNFEYDVVVVIGKGGRERALPFGNRTGKALDQYLRARARHPHHGLEWFWIGRKGRITASGSRSSCVAGATRPASSTCTRICSGTPSHTCGSARAARPT